jgi:hypothetical protein
MRSTTQPAKVIQGDRAKAYRPIPPEARRAALDAALVAWNRADWFEAHEQLEPAWMGTEDADERDLYQGLIKLAAAYVHGARGNAAGMAKNLAGAESRLRRVSVHRETIEGIAVQRLVEDICRRLPDRGGLTGLTLDPPILPVPEEA